MKLPKILTKIFWHEDCRRLYQDETKTCVQRKPRNYLRTFEDLRPETFDVLTPEDKVKVLIELMEFYEGLESFNLDFYSLKEEKEAVRRLKESIQSNIQSVHNLNLESM